MKLLFDFLPIILFFGAFHFAEADEGASAALVNEHLGMLVSGGSVSPGEAPVLLATLVVMLATIAQVLGLKASGRKVDVMLWISLVLVMVLGGLTFWFHNPTFIKWKPSVLYWAMGTVLWLSPLAFGKNLLRSLLGEQFTLPPKVWHRLNFAWVAFFAGMGLLNLWVAHAYSTETWVSFKLFGSLGLMLAFTAAQTLVLNRCVLKSAPSLNRSPESR
jgi:intracellular septation protein